MPDVWVEIHRCRVRPDIIVPRHDCQPERLSWAQLLQRFKATRHGARRALRFAAVGTIVGRVKRGATERVFHLTSGNIKHLVARDPYWLDNVIEAYMVVASDWGGRMTELPSISTRKPAQQRQANEVPGVVATPRPPTRRERMKAEIARKRAKAFGG
jgi:hypothetical protein